MSCATSSSSKVGVEARRLRRGPKSAIVVRPSSDWRVSAMCERSAALLRSLNAASGGCARALAGKKRGRKV